MADGKFSALSKLLGSVGIASSAAAASPLAAPALSNEGDGDDVVGVTSVIDVVPEADALEAVATAKAAGVREGIAAERARTAAVLSSDAAKANLGGAAFLLSKTDASADDIVNDLPQLGGVTPAPKAEAEPAPAAPKLSVPLEETPKVTVGLGSAEANDEQDTDAMWKDVQSKNARFDSTGPILHGTPLKVGH